MLNSTELKGTQNIKLYHFFHTILSNPILSVYHFVHTILSVPFCPLPFCPYHFVRTILSATILSGHRYGLLIQVIHGSILGKFSPLIYVQHWLNWLDTDSE